MEEKAERDEETRTLLIRTSSRTFRLTVPASCKITLGNFNPGSPGPHAHSPTLRIYDSKDKQRACFPDVQEFRDLSFKMEEKVFNAEAGTETWMPEDEVVQPKANTLVQPPDQTKQLIDSTLSHILYGNGG